jgi:hypothetical protein
MHIFFQCHDSLRALEVASLKHVIETRILHYNTAKDLILNICQFESKAVAGMFAMLLWFLWSNWNNSAWNNMKESGQILGAKAMFLWQEWHAAQLISTGPVQTEAHQQQLHWQKPPFGWVICNVDAGFHNNISLTSMGWCIRDHMGQYVMAGSSWSQGKCSIIEGEAHAMLEAMKELEQRGFTHVRFETDSKTVWLMPFTRFVVEILNLAC